jgi:hypothetical protein
MSSVFGLRKVTEVFIASENLSAGNFINKWNDSGTAKVRKADATTEGKQADGFVLVAVTIGNPVVVYSIGQINNQLSGLTVGTQYYLNTTPGGVTITPPATPGNIVQKLGTTSSATEMLFDPYDPVVVT